MRPFITTLVLTGALFGLSQAAARPQAPRPDGLAPLDASAPVTYFVERGTSGAAYREGDPELARWALQAWERAANGKLRFAQGEAGRAILQVHWVPAAAGEYGEMRRTLVNGRPGASVFIRPDTEALGPDIARAARTDPLMRETIVYLTCVHEIGHALGLSHTANFADIMYFFGYGGDIPEFFSRYRRQLRVRDDIGHVSGLSADDVARLRTLYP
jgi:hypothetical protein